MMLSDFSRRSFEEAVNGPLEAPHQPRSDPITIEVAGSVCKAWSPLGKRNGVDSNNHLAFLAWACHVRSSQPVLFIHECHANFPSAVLQNLFEDMYNLLDLVLDPKLLGHPVNRPERRYTWGIRKDHVLRGSIEDFTLMFEAGLVADADMFWCAPDGFLMSELDHLAKNKKCHAEMVRLNIRRDWSDFYPAGAIHRMTAHYVKGLKRVVPVLHGSSDELVIADLEQNPGFGPATGNMIPTLVTHGLIHSFTRLRPLVPLEHLVAMGFNVFHPLHGKELAVKTGLKNCSPAELKRMAGNAMYLPLVGVQILYLLSYLHRKPPVPERRSSSNSLATMRTDGSPELWRRMRSFFSSPAPSQDQDTQDVESRSSVR